MTNPVRIANGLSRRQFGNLAAGALVAKDGDINHDMQVDVDYARGLA